MGLVRVLGICVLMLAFDRIVKGLVTHRDRVNGFRHSQDIDPLRSCAGQTSPDVDQTRPVKNKCSPVRGTGANVSYGTTLVWLALS